VNDGLKIKKWNRLWTILRYGQKEESLTSPAYGVGLLTAEITLLS
jgi:hypothetical protein